MLFKRVRHSNIKTRIIILIAVFTIISCNKKMAYNTIRITKIIEVDLKKEKVKCLPEIGD